MNDRLYGDSGASANEGSFWPLDLVSDSEILAKSGIRSPLNNDEDGLCPSRGRRCPYLFYTFILKYLIPVYSNILKKDQKLSSSNVLLNLLIINHSLMTSFEQHSSVQTQGLPEVLELEILTEASATFSFNVLCIHNSNFQDTSQRKLLRKKVRVASGLLNIINPTLTLTQKRFGFNSSYIHYCYNLKKESYPQVIQRCYTTLIPPASLTYLSTHLNPADLYGPFWTLTTLIFTLFLSSSLAASISAYLSEEGTEYEYNFHLLSIAVSLVYAYGLAVPILLWLALRYLGVGEWSVVEAIAVWGYGQFVWIPVAVSLF